MSDLRMANDAELKLAVKFISDSALFMSDVSKGFSLSELSEGYAATEDAIALFSSAKILFPEWTSMDDTARADLVAFAQANVKVPANVSIEAYVQKALASAIALSAVVAPWVA